MSDETEAVTIEDAETSRRKAITWTRLSRTMFVILALLAVVMVGYLMWSNSMLRAQVNQAYESRDVAYEERDEAIAAWQALFEQVEATGEDPVVDEPDEPTEAPDDEPLAVQGERGETGARGEPGRAPTQAEIVASVLDVCTTTELCTGPAGKTGAKGEPGESIVGEKGDRGEKGDKGDKGDPGAASTAPGPMGPAGPTCPEGTTQTTTAVDTYVEGEVLPTRRQIVVCAVDGEE